MNPQPKMTDRMSGPVQGPALTHGHHGRLCAEHDQLWAQLQGIRDAVAEGALAEAKEAFLPFRATLERHMRVEESVLFPLFTRADLSQNRPLVRSLQSEHATIRHLCNRIADALDQPLAPLQQMDDLASLLEVHEGREELLLYPIAFHLGDPQCLAPILDRIHPQLLMRQIGRA